jgi:hypothetical protein
MILRVWGGRQREGRKVTEPAKCVGLPPSIASGGTIYLPPAKEICVNCLSICLQLYLQICLCACKCFYVVLRVLCLYPYMRVSTSKCFSLSHLCTNIVSSPKFSACSVTGVASYFFLLEERDVYFCGLMFLSFLELLGWCLCFWTSRVFEHQI